MLAGLLPAATGCLGTSWVGDEAEPVQTALWTDLGDTGDFAALAVLVANTRAHCHPEDTADDAGTTGRDEEAIAADRWAAEWYAAMTREGARIAAFVLRVEAGEQPVGSFEIAGAAWDFEEGELGTASAASLWVEESRMTSRDGVYLVEEPTEFELETEEGGEVETFDSLGRLGARFQLDGGWSGEFYADECDDPDVLRSLVYTLARFEDWVVREAETESR